MAEDKQNTSNERKQDHSKASTDKKAINELPVLVLDVIRGGQ